MERNNVFVAFPIEEGLKLGEAARSGFQDVVFVAFPIEEGLKQNEVAKIEEMGGSFCGFSNRRRIETD